MSDIGCMGITWLLLHKLSIHGQHQPVVHSVWMDRIISAAVVMQHYITVPGGN